MPDLKLAALNVAPSPSAPPSSVRGQDAQSAPGESGTSSFGDAMAQAATSHTGPADEPSAPAKTRPANRKATPQRLDERRAKADRVAVAKSSAKSDGTDPSIGVPVADVTGPDAHKKPSTDTGGLEQVASVLATIGTSPSSSVINSGSAGKTGVDAKGLEQVEGTLAAGANVATAAPTAETTVDNGSPGAESIPDSAARERVRPSGMSAARQSTDTLPGYSNRTPSMDANPLHATREANGADGSNAHRNGSETGGRNDTATAVAPGAILARRDTVTTGQAAQTRDRLLEDFQQRFERALTTAASSSSASSRGDAGAPNSTAASAFAGLSSLGTPPSGAVQITVPTPVGVAAFTEDFSQRVSLLTRGKVHSAELSLTPADLGPVTVSIEVRGNEATLVFGAAHEATRTAISEALPRLREMLDAQGLQLADARVGTQAGDTSPRDGNRPQRGQFNPPANEAAATNAVIAPSATPPVTVRSTRLIDVIA